MLIRTVLYLASITLTQKMVNYVFSRNQLAGIYPPEADSIGIPIFENQIFLGVLTILIFPTAVFGSRWIFERIFDIHAVFRVVGLIAFAGFYALALLVSLGMALSHMDQAHIELGLSYAGILAVLSTFFIWDGMRVYRKLQNKRQMAAEISMMEQWDVRH